MAKDEVPVLTLNPTEPPLAGRLGAGPAGGDRADRRPPADQRGNPGRQSPATSGSTGRRASGPGLARSCVNSGARCPLPCGPVCVRRPRPPGPRCRATSISATAATAATPAAPDDQRPASAASTRATRSSASTSGSRAMSKARILPTNVVCVYAPRFAEVRVSTRHERRTSTSRRPRPTRRSPSSRRPNRMVDSRRLVQNQAAELARARRGPRA